MAKIETIHKDFGDSINPSTKERFGVVEGKIFNLAHPVGPRMPNHLGDVMVIQAMLNVIASMPAWAEYNGLKPSAMPGVTGRFDQKTEAAIWSFQKARHYNLLSIDGVVHPGSFENRTLKLDGRYMAIVLLNNQAAEVCQVKYYSYDHTEGIARIYPQVIAAVYL
jgi:hypothetical protein